VEADNADSISANHSNRCDVGPLTRTSKLISSRCLCLGRKHIWVYEQVLRNSVKNILNLGHCPTLLPLKMNICFFVCPLFVNNFVEALNKLSPPGLGKKVPRHLAKERSN
jgi:hypothetical protein